MERSHRRGAEGRESPSLSGRQDRAGLKESVRVGVFVGPQGQHINLSRQKREKKSGPLSNMSAKGGGRMRRPHDKERIMPSDRRISHPGPSLKAARKTEKARRRSSRERRVVTFLSRKEGEDHLYSRANKGGGRGRKGSVQMGAVGKAPKKADRLVSSGREKV